MHYPAKQVRPYKLWIGSERDSEDAGAALKHNVGLIVNCTRDIPFTVPGVKHVRVPLHDSPAETSTFLRHFAKAVGAIDEHLQKGDTVLVHCFAGISRSASVVAAYLMLREGLTPREAIKRIQGCKPETFGRSPNFLEALEKIHAHRAHAVAGPR